MAITEQEISLVVLGGAQSVSAFLPSIREVRTGTADTTDLRISQVIASMSSLATASAMAYFLKSNRPLLVWAVVTGSMFGVYEYARKHPRHGY